MRHIDEIVVHCLATRAGWMQGQSVGRVLAEVRRWHTTGRAARGLKPWRQEGYHAIIHFDGTIAYGRPPEMQGAGVAGHNKTTLHIALNGGHGSAADDQFSDHFTPEQEQALVAQIKAWMDDYSTITKVSGHNQYANKACPGFNVPLWWNGVIGKPVVKEHWLLTLLKALFGKGTK